VAREPANLGLDLVVISDAFVVVVVGGMGSITGAFVAAVIIAEVKACASGWASSISAPLPSTSPSSRWWRNSW
jgi:branched-subunit amino acid ABC-type transport system permease component